MDDNREKKVSKKANEDDFQKAAQPGDVTDSSSKSSDGNKTQLNNKQDADNKESIPGGPTNCPSGFEVLVNGERQKVVYSVETREQMKVIQKLIDEQTKESLPGSKEPKAKSPVSESFAEAMDAIQEEIRKAHEEQERKSAADQCKQKPDKEEDKSHKDK